MIHGRRWARVDALKYIRWTLRTIGIFELDMDLLWDSYRDHAGPDRFAILYKYSTGNSRWRLAMP